MDEQQRRLNAGLESMKLGHGGDRGTERSSAGREPHSVFLVSGFERAQPRAGSSLPVGRPSLERPQTECHQYTGQQNQCRRFGLIARIRDGNGSIHRLKRPRAIESGTVIEESIMRGIYGDPAGPPRAPRPASQTGSSSAADAEHGRSSEIGYGHIKSNVEIETTSCSKVGSPNLTCKCTMVD